MHWTNQRLEHFGLKDRTFEAIQGPCQQFEVGGLEIFFSAHHSFQKLVKEFLINPLI